jgi:hypothetical protein
MKSIYLELNGETQLDGAEETMVELHLQIGVDDCSTDLELRGFPSFAA